MLLVGRRLAVGIELANSGAGPKKGRLPWP